jgi:hypothetical protein
MNKNTNGFATYKNIHADVETASVVATSDLKFKGGILHQKFVTIILDEFCRPKSRAVEWKPVPSDDD